MNRKYSKYKIFYYKEKLASLPKSTKEILPPIHIRIKPTNRCNHNCWYCAYRADNLQLGKDMNIRDSIPKDKMFEIIEDCKDMGVKAITFSGGGEPFVYEYFLETVKKIIESKIAFASLTNGSKLKGEIAELFAHHATWLRISIDGWDDESYSKYRNVKIGEFTKILKNIENFKKIGGKCILGISYIVDKNNYKYIYDFAKLMKNLGVDSFKIAPCIVDNSGRKNNEYHSSFFDKAKELAIKTKIELEDDNFEVFDAYHTQLDSFEKNYDWCPYLQILPVIGADLNIYPCQDKAYNLEDGLIGSIKNVSFKEFWFNNKEKFFKINPSKVCNHHCVANEKNTMILEYLNIDKEHLGFV
ncbi:radical SAM/SPASM domain-containing protein [Hippea jasoniae]|uniref:radical SAM/SPASM domain-containing protein n=1 Tax=Hippea jasoniae TaxID=944479 RepID=UPI000551A4B0|nr:radical SAM protein [Hippea jasoniae]